MFRIRDIVEVAVKGAVLERLGVGHFAADVIGGVICYLRDHGQEFCPPSYGRRAQLFGVVCASATAVMVSMKML